MSKSKLYLLPSTGGPGGGISDAPNDGVKYARKNLAWVAVTDEYIDGEVETHADLPVVVGDPPVDSAYLVREASGLWFVNRKPAGIWIRTANAGALTDWSYAGTFPDVFSDANFVLFDDSDSTKELAFSLGGITTGTKRTLTIPDKSGTIALLDDIAAAGTKTWLSWDALRAQPPASGYGTFDTVTDIGVIDLDGANLDESFYLMGYVPEGQSSAGGAKVRIAWTPDTATSGVARLRVRVRKYDSETASWSSWTTVTTASISDATTAVVTDITVAAGDLDGITAGDFFVLEVGRNASDTTNDTLASDIQVAGVVMEAA